MTQEVKPPIQISWIMVVGIAIAVGAGLFCCVLGYGLISGLILNPETPSPTPESTLTPMLASTPDFLPTFPALDATDTPQAAAPIKYTVIHQWQPNNLPEALGMDVLLESEPSPQELVDFLIELGARNDPVVIHVYGSMEAYDDAERTSQAYKEGYIASYKKDLTGSEPDSKQNEVRWMQESGAYSALFGTVTRLNAGETTTSETPTE
jgi:hypothetical protein